MNNEELEKFQKELFDEVDHEEKVITFKCKPCWQFQSIEFEFKGAKKDIPEMIDLYTEVLAKLMLITPEQKKEVSQPAVPLATDKQKEIMRRFNIDFTNKTTQKEAQALIQASIDKASK